MNLLTMTPELRLIYRQRAAEKREADKLFAKNNLRNNFSDKNHWRRLASHYGVTMPAWYNRTTRVIRRAYKRLGLDGRWLTDTTGCSSLSELMAQNPTWPSYAFVGLALEAAHERDSFEELPDDEESDDED